MEVLYHGVGPAAGALSFAPDARATEPVCQRRFHEVGAYNVPGAFRYGDLTDRNHRLVRAAYWAMVDLIDVQLRTPRTVVRLRLDHTKIRKRHVFRSTA